MLTAHSSPERSQSCAAQVVGEVVADTSDGSAARSVALLTHVHAPAREKSLKNFRRRRVPGNVQARY